MMNLMMRLWKDEEGQGMVEYGLIIALVSIVVIGILAAIGGEDEDSGLQRIFAAVRDALASAGN